MGKQSNLALVVESRRFQWSEIRSRACVLLAEGYKVGHVARECGVSVRTIERFMAHPEFAQSVDKVTMMTGIALASERMRIIKRAINQAIASGRYNQNKTRHFRMAEAGYR
jgi:hypothetical protein